eukprot:2071473-Amphidinium_carterae.1
MAIPFGGEKRHRSPSRDCAAFAAASLIRHRKGASFGDLLVLYSRGCSVIHVAARTPHLLASVNSETSSVGSVLPENQCESLQVHAIPNMRKLAGHFRAEMPTDHL